MKAICFVEEQLNNWSFTKLVFIGLEFSHSNIEFEVIKVPNIWDETNISNIVGQWTESHQYADLFIIKLFGSGDIHLNCLTNPSIKYAYDIIGDTVTIQEMMYVVITFNFKAFTNM